MRMIVISVRNDEAVYKAAERRIRDMVKKYQNSKEDHEERPLERFRGASFGGSRISCPGLENSVKLLDYTVTIYFKIVRE